MSGTRRYNPGYLILLATLAVLGASCESEVTPQPVNSGIEGTVTIGPTCPVEIEASPCADEPYQATIIIEDADGDVASELTTDAAGRFRLDIGPGRYTLVPQSPNPGAPPFAEEQEVVVEADHYTDVTIAYDSGIR